MDKLKSQLLKAIARYPEFWIIGPFTASSGLVIPIAPNLRVLFSHPKVLRLLGKMFVREIKKLKGLELLAGIETAGIPPVTLASYLTGLPMVYIRTKSQSRFSKSCIDGVYQKGAKTVLIDDAFTLGSQKVAVLKKIKNLLKVKYILTIWDSDYPDNQYKRFIRNQKIKRIALVGKLEIINYLKKVKKIHNNSYQLILAQAKNPWHWNNQETQRLMKEVKRRGTI